MSDDLFEPSSSRFRPLLRRIDQACVAVVIGLSLLAMAAYWVMQGGHRGDLIEIERAEPLSSDFQVDINSADWPELMLLPDVGETLARRIVQWRQQHGPFAEPDDLMRVPGIGPKTLARIRPYLQPLETTETVASQ